jgi:hypothetical protein
MNAYTVWVGKGRIGTYRTREKAEQVQAEVIGRIAELIRIQEWMPEPHHEPYVTFDDEDELMEE